MAHFLTTRLVIAFALALLAGVGPAQAGTETHYISVQQGSVRTGDETHGPQVRVHVDRPGQEVRLVLFSGKPARWYVTTGEQTGLAKVVFAGRGGGTSELFVNGARHFDLRYDEEIPRFRTPGGAKFLRFLHHMQALYGTARLDSLTGFSTAPSAPIEVIAARTDDATLGLDHLRGLATGPEGLSPKLQAAFRGEARTPRAATRFDADGMALRRPDETWQEFPASLDVPEISHPVASAFVAGENAIYGVSLGGEGYLYRVDAKTGAWSVAASMQNVDAMGMFPDARGDRLVLLAFDHAHHFEFHWFDLRSRTYVRPGHSMFAAPGFRDFRYRRNQRGAALEVLGQDGDTVLLKAYPRRAETAFEAGMFRVWTVNIATGAVALIAYEGAPFAATGAAQDDEAEN